MLPLLFPARAENEAKCGLGEHALGASWDLIYIVPSSKAIPYLDSVGLNQDLHIQDYFPVHSEARFQQSR